MSGKNLFARRRAGPAAIDAQLDHLGDVPLQ